MAETKQAATRKRAGRPRIEDHLDVLVFVAIAQRVSGLSVRQTLRNRKVVFEGALVPNPRHSPVRRAIRGDALRRRYGQARKALQIDAPQRHPHVSCDGEGDYQRALSEFIESVVKVFAS